MHLFNRVTRYSLDATIVKYYMFVGRTSQQTL